MPKDKITRITVGGHPTGIIGLKPILEEVAKEYIGKSDDEIKAELLNPLSPKSCPTSYSSNYLAKTERRRTWKSKYWAPDAQDAIRPNRM